MIPLATFGWYFNECACGALNSLSILLVFEYNAIQVSACLYFTHIWLVFQCMRLS